VVQTAKRLLIFAVLYVPDAWISPLCHLIAEAHSYNPPHEKIKLDHGCGGAGARRWRWCVVVEPQPDRGGGGLAHGAD
jgi:hypothetical protein